jgi:hypothetical protein
MVNNSTNIDKANNHFSPYFTEHKNKGTMTDDVENPGPCFGQAVHISANTLWIFKIQNSFCS